MTLDPQVLGVLDMIEASDLPLLETLAPAEARLQYEQAAARAAGTPPAMYEIEDLKAEGPLGAIPLRRYTPRDPDGQALPLLIYLHGGGYVIGSRDSHDVPCRHLARAADCVVVSVDYRMAPEHPFPAPVDDCRAAVAWIARHAGRLGGDVDRIAIGGDSAGANLATVICLLARDAGGPRFVHQLLIYPCTDLTGSFASHDELAHGYRLTRSLITWFMDHYFSGAHSDRRNPRASPLFADDLSGLPPALIVTAGYDPLRDEGQAYHKALRRHGGESTLRHYPGMIHGFINMPGFIDKAGECLAACGAELAAVFERPG